MPTQVEAGNIKPRIQFTADGEQKEFQFFFTIYEPENVKVYIEDVLQIGGYSLSLNEEVPGGIVVFAEPPSAGKLITVYRDLELKRTTDFKEGGPFRSSKVNAEFDYQLSCLEQLEDSIGRTVTFPQYAPTNLNINLPMPDAGKSIIWSADENSLVNSEYQFDTVIDQSRDYCSQSGENLAVVRQLAAQVEAGRQSVAEMQSAVAALQENAADSAGRAAASAAEAAANAVNSLYNQSKTAENFAVVLQDGVTVYRTPPISSAAAITFDFSRLSRPADMVTFELYLCFTAFATVTFEGITLDWLNGKEPNLTQNNTLTKILTFRNKNPGDFSRWIASMEGGY